MKEKFTGLKTETDRSKSLDPHCKNIFIILDKNLFGLSPLTHTAKISNEQGTNCWFKDLGPILQEMLLDPGQ